MKPVLRTLALFLIIASDASAQALPPPAFFGGVPSGTVSPQPLKLSIADAIAKALQYNLGLLNAERGVDRARGLREEELADLLPNVNGRVSESRQKVNLAAFGFPIPPESPRLWGRSTCSMRACTCPRRSSI